ncbi:hypothetical protein Kpho02_70970 [Kitasatospora phosalacinea]|uniref:DUF4259 domain-containing protein n=1 Tax=Kitasatospora phosalacinea TaxID=2065 RepID=A0A9W6QE73_9ACTN|nr:DUF4259 domain-containing protein [Kitasatospora phosalacinea]GLW74800.1 hypothetical protein Kpho02_70970 [Kitasatospora phosalacinea]
MGTWGTGPFDSDLAGDFIDGLNGLPAQELVAVLGSALQRVVSAGDHVDGGDGQEAVAAAVLVAAQLPDSGIFIDPDDGPKEPLPPLPSSLHSLARSALQRVLGDGSELAQGWTDSSDASEWRREVEMILDALNH